MKRGRVPATIAPRWRVEVATGGNPVGALVRAAQQVRRSRGGLWHVDVHHDDGCPASPDGPMAACTCEIVQVEGRRAA